MTFLFCKISFLKKDIANVDFSCRFCMADFFFMADIELMMKPQFSLDLFIHSL